MTETARYTCAEI